MNPELINRFIDSLSPVEIALAHLYGCAQTCLEHPDNFPAQFGGITLARLLEHTLPTETVSETSLRSVQRNASQNIKWDDLKRQKAAVLFILPPDTFATPNGGSLQFITVVRNDAYIPFQIPGHPMHATKFDSVMVCGGSMGRDMGFYAVNVRKSDFESAEYNPNNIDYADKAIRTPQGVVFQKCDPTESEKLFEFQMFRVGLGLLMNIH